MFRAIKEPVLKRGERVAGQLQQKRGIAEIVFHCLCEVLGVEYARQIVVHMDTETRELILSSPKKTLSSQLVLYTSDIRASLVTERISVKRIVVR